MDGRTEPMCRLHGHVRFVCFLLLRDRAALGSLGGYVHRMQIMSQSYYIVVDDDANDDAKCKERTHTTNTLYRNHFQLRCSKTDGQYVATEMQHICLLTSHHTRSKSCRDKIWFICSWQANESIMNLKGLVWMWVAKFSQVCKQCKPVVNIYRGWIKMIKHLLLSASHTRINIKCTDCETTV